jgi:hypothetical protein
MFIAITCGKLDAVLQKSSTGEGNVIPAVKTYQNGSATKPHDRTKCKFVCKT